MASEVDLSFEQLLISVLIVALIEMIILNASNVQLLTYHETCRCAVMVCDGSVRLTFGALHSYHRDYPNTPCCSYLNLFQPPPPHLTSAHKQSGFTGEQTRIAPCSKATSSPSSVEMLVRG